MARSSTICVGTFAGAHGVKGLVRLRSFTEEPEAILAYGPLSDEGGKRVFAVRLKSSANDHFIAEVEGVTGREEAEALRGVKLDAERIKHWIKNGAQPSDRVARFLYAADLGPKVEYRETPKKSAPRAKTQERLKLEAAEAEKAAAKPAEAPAPKAEAAPAAEAPAAPESAEAPQA